ncbi:hypothetical protein Cob_v008149 [Colletotrichum orbiculare MAFF 240422]|uniref:Uncharacterized protein n=1 Tax=Colletotrichum orbiculare (strain 104-T / ATCC 96160 / CBS 514.97 / LARS 414 / MAFF 240422) TaxID=1213857 RepID=A0A484FMD0_COLOR|nr:hypothetical protein Cob_v008149 [Colletotrichum orbiculare MAFF 240422]
MNNLAQPDKTNITIDTTVPSSGEATADIATVFMTGTQNPSLDLARATLEKCHNDILHLSRQNGVSDSDPTYRLLRVLLGLLDAQFLKVEATHHDGNRIREIARVCVIELNQASEKYDFLAQDHLSNKARLVNMGDQLGKVEDKLGKLEDKLGKLEDKLGNLDVKVLKLDGRVSWVEDRLRFV